VDECDSTGAFLRLKNRLRKHGITPEEPFIPYTFRHTFAKRMMEGYWAPPVDFGVLAELMGITLETCVQHYDKTLKTHPDILWGCRQRPTIAGITWHRHARFMEDRGPSGKILCR